MDRYNIDNKVKEIISLILKMAKEEVCENTTVYSVSTWDSLQQMNMVSVLEDEFDIEFNQEQISRMSSYNMIINEVTYSLSQK